MVQSAIVKAAESEWGKLLQTELTCVDQKLHERGDSVQSLTRRGIFPFDPRIAGVRSQCGTLPASSSPDTSRIESSSPAHNVLAKQRGIGEFARIVSIPQDCQTARELRRAQFNQRPFANSEVCRAVLTCFEMVRSQTADGLEFFKRHPAVAQAFRDQLHAVNPHDVRVDGWLATLQQRLSFLNEVATTPSYSDCSHRGQFINEWISLVNPRSSALRGGLFDPQKGLFEKFSIIGQAVLMNARNDYKAIEAEYHELIAFNDEYAGVDRLHQAQAAYRKTFEDDDVAGMIQERPTVLQKLEQARARKLLLSRQTEELVSLENRLSRLSDIVTQDPLSKLISREVLEVLSNLQSEARKLREKPPRLRGDVDPALKELRLRETDVGTKTAAAQAKFEGLKKRDERRRDVLSAIAKIAPEFAGPKIQQRLGGSAITALTNLHDRQIELLRLSEVPLVDQPDYDEILKAVDTDLDVLRGVQRSIQMVDDYVERVRTLKVKVDERGAHLLDSDTASLMAMLSRTASLMQTKLVPLNGSDEKQLSEALSSLSRLETDLPSIMRAQEVKLLTVQFPISRKLWQFRVDRDGITDEDVAVALGTVEGTQANYQIEFSCKTSGATLLISSFETSGQSGKEIPRGKPIPWELLNAWATSSESAFARQIKLRVSPAPAFPANLRQRGYSNRGQIETSDTSRDVLRIINSTQFIFANVFPDETVESATNFPTQFKRLCDLKTTKPTSTDRLRAQ
jgi:hypothetical protein